MNRRILVLPLAAAVITGLVAWRLQQEGIRRQRPRSIPVPRNLGPAPPIEGSNQSGSQTKLSAYLGRTKIAVYFTGGETSLADDARLISLADAQPAMAAAGVQLLVVSPVPPQEVRALEKRRGKPFPFPVVADIDLSGGLPTPAHRNWGLIDSPAQPPRGGLFLIDRAGLTETRVDGSQPKPVVDFGATLRQLASGRFSPRRATAPVRVVRPLVHKKTRGEHPRRRDDRTLVSPSQHPSQLVTPQAVGVLADDAR